MSYLAKNFAYSTLASPITNVATSLTVGAGHGDRFPAITAPDYTKAVIEDGSGNREVIHVTARTLGSDVFTTIVRAQEGTTARNWAAGVSVELRQTADLVQTAMGHPAATSAAHAATAISNTPAGGIAATTVQAAINELDVKCVKTVNGVAPTAGNVDVVSWKNYIINGGCVVAQRGNVAAAASGTWGYGGSDRIATLIVGTTATGTLQRYSGVASGTWYAHGVQATTTGAGGIYFQQRVESFNTVGLNSKQVTVSCLVYQNTGSAQNAAIIIGKPTTTADTFSAQTALSTSGNFSIPSGTPTKISWTYTLGAAEATLGLYAQVGFASVGAVTAKDFWISDFQLEQGAISTLFEIRPLGVERMLCQRYYLITPISCIYYNGYCVIATSNFPASYSYPVTMRVAPVVTAPTWALTQSSTPVLAAYSEQSISYYGAGTTASGTIAFNNSTGIKLDAEL